MEIFPACLKRRKQVVNESKLQHLLFLTITAHVSR